MDDAQEQDHYEERLREVFNSFDASGSGSLCPEELSDLCQSLHLDDATPALLRALLQDQDRLTGRVDFDQFKNALIVVLSSAIEPPQAEQEAVPQPESPVIQPKFVKGSKRYGRRSTPEFIKPVSDSSRDAGTNPAEEKDLEEDNDDSAVPRKRERWNAHKTTTEEFEAEGQMHLWNPDEPSTSRGSIAPPSDRPEERLRDACDELAVPWDGCAGRPELLALCEHLGLEIKEDVLRSLSGDGEMNVQDFVSRVVNHIQPLTSPSSTPYRQLKRHHSTQPFDEGGRRIATLSAMTSTIGMRLFSSLDDGTGYTPVEYVLDAWMEEGVENSTEILQALDFSLDGKVNLGELTTALENELLVTKNGIHRAALASFKAEIRYLMERVDRELGEKEKIRSDLEKAEKLKSHLATEVDEHHSAIERMNSLNLRKLEQDHKEKLAAVRSELIKEMDQLQQQAGLQREELEAEMEKIRGDESFLRDHLSISVKENRRLEMELLDSTEKLVAAQSQICKLQTSLDNILKEKFGDLDPGSADVLRQEERIKRLRSSYEEQCRELQDRIDELQSELQEFHSLGRAHLLCNKPLSEEMESKSPGMESDPGLGSEEVQPFSMSLEAEMMLEQLKEQHLQDTEDLRTQLESKIGEFAEMVEEQRAAHEEQKDALSRQYQEEVRALREGMASVQSHAQELQSQLEQAALERACLEQRQAGEREELANQQEEEAGNLRQQLLEAHAHAVDLEVQLKTLEALQAETELNLSADMEELKKRHAVEMKKVEERHEERFEARLEEERTRRQEERAEMEKALFEDCKERLQQSHEDELRARLEEASVRFEGERDELVKRLTEEWQKERAQLDEQSNETLQLVLEDEMLRLVKEQEEKESELRAQWEIERARLQEGQEEALRTRVAAERLQLQRQHEQTEKRLKEEWEREISQLEEYYEGMLQERLNEEREKLGAEKEEVEKRLEELMEEEKARLEESHREAMQELTAKHSEERETLSSTLDKLREDIVQERRELEIHFARRIKDVEDRFSGDQESVAERFQADVSKLERHYQSELKALSESHAEQKLKWEAEAERAREEAEEQRRMTQRAVELERRGLNQEWTKRQRELESSREEEVEALLRNKRELQKELDDFVSSAQTKEILLSRQLNDLHTRLQQSLGAKDELLAQSERKAVELELLLNQTEDGFKQERAELRSSLSELETKYKAVFSTSERRREKSVDLLTERDDFKTKVEELEMLLQQAAADFVLERRELQENIAILEERLRGHLSCRESQENERVELIAERDLLSFRVKELQMDLGQLFTSAAIAEKDKMEESSEIKALIEEALQAGGCMSLSGEERETCSVPIELHRETCGGDDDEEVVVPDDSSDNVVEAVDPLEQFPEVEIISEPANEHDICPGDDITDTHFSNWEADCSSPNLSVPVEVSTSPVEQDDNEEPMPETPEGWPKNTDCADEAPAGNDDDDNVPAGETGAIESQEQDSEAIAEGRMAKMNDPLPVNTRAGGEECDSPFSAVPEDRQVGESSSPDEAEDDTDVGACPQSPVPDESKFGDAVDEKNVPNQEEDFAQERQREGSEAVSSPEALEHEDAGEESGAEERKPQDVLALENEGPSHGDEKCHEIAVDPSALERTSDPGELIPQEAEVNRFSIGSHDDHGKDVELVSPECEQTSAEIDDEEAYGARDSLEPWDQIVDCEDRVCSLLTLQALYNDATEENIILHDKISLLQQKTNALENLLARDSEKMETGRQILEENYHLKVNVLFLMEQVKELELKALKVTELQIRHDECVCENAKLKAQNGVLEKRVWSLESRMDIIHDFQDQHIALVDEIARTREENAKLSEMISELERQDDAPSAVHADAAGSPGSPAEEPSRDLKTPAETDLEDCCVEIEMQNAKLRGAIAELQDKSLVLNERLQTHRSEASRLAEENLVLRHKIAALKEEDLKEAQEELLQKLERARKEKIAAQKRAEHFKKQAAELRLQNQQLQEEKGLLSERESQNAVVAAELKQQLAELMQDERSGAVSAEERSQVVGVDAMESQLSRLLQERKCVDKETQGLRHQLAKAQERVKTADDTLQAVDRQSALLKSDLRVSQQERDALKHEVVSLHQQLQNASDKNRVLKMALHPGGVQSPNKKPYRDEMCRLLDQEQQLLRQENERLQAEVQTTKGDLVHSREKVRQLESTILSLKQHRQQSQSGLLAALEQQNACLKQQLELKNLLTGGRADEDGRAELESLRQENEALKARMNRLSTQLLEAFQAQMVGLLPPSPHRTARGQHRGDEPDNMQQDERQRKMELMEERMKEIELSLRNVKLLLREKVTQLRDQLHKSCKADVLINDLYVENGQLLQALEVTEQRQKIAEKKNYLLEEKISSLNRIVRDLNPPPLPPVPYHFQCS